MVTFIVMVMELDLSGVYDNVYIHTYIHTYMSCVVDRWALGRVLTEQNEHSGHYQNGAR